MSRRLTDALYDCLERIEAGAPPDAVLARYPELRADLAPLLEAAQAVRALPPRPARVAFRSRVQRELDRLEAERAVERGPRAWWSGVLAALAPRPAPALRVAAAVVALVLVAGGLVAVSADSRPGDPLYPVRAAAERVWGAVRPSGSVPADVGGDNTEEPPPGADGRAVGRQPTAVARRPGPVGPTRATAVASSTPTVEAPPATPTALVVVVVVPTFTPPATATPPPPQEPREEPEPTEESSPATATPQPTATVTAWPTPSPTPPSGPVVVRGTVKQGDGGSGRPLERLVVSVYRDFTTPVCPPPGGVDGHKVGQVTTDATGAYELHLPPGVYVIAAEGRTPVGECFPAAWWVGGPAATGDMCSAGPIDVSDGVSPAVPFDLLYTEDVDTTCP